MSNRDNIFSSIYRDSVWGNGSGDGSNPDYAIPYVDFVASIIKRLRIISVLDVGHGDWQMWRDYKFEDTSYFGVDVADRISELNTIKYGDEKRKFMQVKSNDELPDAELLLCKDVLQHLSLDDIAKILKQLDKFKYLVLCNDYIRPDLITKARHLTQLRSRMRKVVQGKSPFYRPIQLNNSEISTGGYRTLDLEDLFFSNFFTNFELVKKINYRSEHSDKRFKRILFYKNLSF